MKKSLFIFFYPTQGEHMYFDYDEKETKLVPREIFIKDTSETVEMLFPESWSDTSCELVANKYFHRVDAENRETSLLSVCRRMVEKRLSSPILARAMINMIMTQHFAPNSPTWFNIGIKSRAQQSSACFVTPINDSLVHGKDSILDVMKIEATIFKGGSGSGMDVSTLRAKGEPLGSMLTDTSGHGRASGPLSFMRPLDSLAGAIKSGGATRRAAKLVSMMDWHYDLLEFITCKRDYEIIGRKIVKHGIIDDPMQLQELLPYQNANLCVRLTNDFMEAVNRDSLWTLHGVLKSGDGSYRMERQVSAKEIMDTIINCIWETGEPVIQFHDTINEWNTTTEEITASNPCSEYHGHGSCNLGSHNLLSYYKENGMFDVDRFVEGVSVAYRYLNNNIDMSSYPTEDIKYRTLKYRDVGMGYTNLGSLLIVMGLPYGSEEGRMIASLITSLMTAVCYKKSFEESASIRRACDFREEYEAFDKKKHYNILDKHITSAELLINKANNGTYEQHPNIDGIAMEVEKQWNKCKKFMEDGAPLSNANVTLLAPTGTTRIALGAATTGCEPEFSLAYKKHLADSDGDTITFINPHIEDACSELEIDSETTKNIVDHIREFGDMASFPVDYMASDEEREKIYELKDVLLTAMPDSNGDCISPMDHIKMIAAIQPHLSMGISKTVNLPHNITRDEIKELLFTCHELGIKSISFYRDGSKSYQQPLETIKKKDNEIGSIDNINAALNISRVKPPKVANCRRVKIKILDGSYGEYPIYIHLSEYGNGELAEVFITGPKQGNLSQGLLNVISVQMSYLLQLGVGIDYLIEKFEGMNFTPSGMCECEVPGILFVSSPIDAIMKVIKHYYGNKETATFEKQHKSKSCPKCEHSMKPDGTLCWYCANCGYSSGGCSG
jgi:ribonucleoside-diphosphate reductase alpha chain